MPFMLRPPFTLPLLSLIALLVSAAPEARAGDDFCARPVEAICRSPATGQEARQQRVRSEISTVTAAVLKDASSRFKLKLSSVEQVENLQGPRRAEVWRYLQAEVERRLIGNAVIPNFKAVWASFSRVQGSLLKAIKNNVPKGPDQDRLVQKVKSVEPVTREHLALLRASEKAEHHRDVDALDRAFLQICGPLGLADNAFAVPLADDRRYLVICPGKVLSGVGSGQEDSGNFRNLLRTLSHELAHHIDTDELGDFYKPYLDCLADNYADLLQTDPKAKKVLHGLGPEGARAANREKVDTHADEIVADFWGAASVAQYVWDHARNPGERLLIMREAAGSLCGSVDEGIHPTGDFRIGVLLRGAPHMNVVMACKGVPMAPRVQCSLRGALSGDEVFLLSPPERSSEALRSAP